MGIVQMGIVQMGIVQMGIVQMGIVQVKRPRQSKASSRCRELVLGTTSSVAVDEILSGLSEQWMVK